jgi:hypothetical protein
VGWVERLYAVYGARWQHRFYGLPLPPGMNRATAIHQCQRSAQPLKHRLSGAQGARVAEAREWILHIGHDGGAWELVDGEAIGVTTTSFPSGISY